MTTKAVGLNIVIFEDEESTLEKIYSQLSQIGANIVGEARTLPDAYKVLEQMISKAITADVILLDGNLAHTWNTPAFEMRLPASPESTGKKGLLGKLTAKRGERVVVNPFDYGVGARDAIVILEILRLAKVDAKVIGISRDEMHQIGLDVDFDLTKDGIDHLAACLSGLSE
jgi:DNA-binding NarL/FixJ family response regulator